MEYLRKAIPGSGKANEVSQMLSFETKKKYPHLLACLLLNLSFLVLGFCAPGGLMDVSYLNRQRKILYFARFPLKP